MRKLLALGGFGAFAAALVLGPVACGGGGGGSGARFTASTNNSTGGSSTGGTSTTGSGTQTGGTGSGQTGGTGGTFVGNDLVPPDVQITHPSRGEYLTQYAYTVEGTATDIGGSGVNSLIVNGNTVTPDPVTGAFSYPMTMSEGANCVVVRAVDRAGNVGSAAVGCMVSARYRLATEEIPSAFGARVNEATLNAIAPTIANQIASSGAIQAQLMSRPVFRGQVDDPIFGFCLASSEVTVQSVSFNPIQIQFDCVPGGINALVQVPNFRLQANARSYCGIPYSISGEVSAQTAVVDCGLALAIDAQGNYTAQVTRSAVALNGFRFDIYGIPSIIENLVRSTVQREAERRLADEVRQQLPTRTVTALQNLSQPIQRAFNGQTVTLTIKPARADFDDAGITVDFSGNVTAAKNPATPTVPGSVFRAPPAGVLPTYASAPGFYVSVNENAVNRALFTSWQAGLFNLQIDQTFLAQFNVSLPFNLNSNLVAAFFPQLAGMLTPNTTIPLRIDIAPMMQPVVKVAGQGSQDLFEAAIDEVHVTVMMDFGPGLGWQPFMSVAAHLEGAANATLANNQFAFTLTPGTTFEADMIGQPLLAIAGLDVERFLQFVVPPAIQLAAASIRPVPLPALQGLTLLNLRVYGDGQQREFLTLDGDVQ